MASSIQFKTLNQLVQLQLDYISANAPVVLNIPLGPFVTAIVYAVALIGLTLQRLIQLVLAASRLSTSTDVDVDSFVADYGMSRAPGVASAGLVFFGRNVTAVTQIVIPVGTIVQTSSFPPIQFQVIGDSTNSSFVAAQNAYVMLSGGTSVSALVQCMQPGIVGNVLLGVINKIGSALPGIDFVSNPAAFTTGIDTETDAQLKDRFSLWIQSLSKATKTAIESAIDGIQPGLIYVVNENVDVNGNVLNGQFVATVDDGSASLSNQLRALISQAIERVRPVGVRQVVLGPVLGTTITAFAHIVVAYNPLLTPNVTTLYSIILNAFINYVNATSFLEQVRLSRSYKAIWDATSSGQAANTEVVALPASLSNIIYVASTFGFAIGQLIKITDSVNNPRLTSLGTYPSITAIDVDQSITIYPPLASFPQVGDAIEGFTITDGQIVNINALTLGTFPTTPVFTLGSSASPPVGMVGCAKNVVTSGLGVPGICTAIYIQSATGFAVTDNILFPGFQPDPATLNPTDAIMRPKVMLVTSGLNTQVSPTVIYIQPPLGILAADGSWAPFDGNVTIMPYNTLVNKANLAGETSLAPTVSLGGTNYLLQITRSGQNYVMISMVSTVA